MQAMPSKNLSGTRIEPVSPPWKGGMITTTLTAHVLDGVTAVSYTHLDVYKRQRLSDDLEARRLLKIVLPAKLRDNTFTEVLRDDVGSKRCLAQLLLTLNEETS